MAEIVTFYYVNLGGYQGRRVLKDDVGRIRTGTWLLSYMDIFNHNISLHGHFSLNQLLSQRPLLNAVFSLCPLFLCCAFLSNAKGSN